MIIEVFGFALTAGIILFIKYRIWVAEDAWRTTYRIHRAETVNTRLPLTRVKPTQWDYDEGIPRWNTAYIMACGFDPRHYRPTRGDSDILP